MVKLLPMKLVDAFHGNKWEIECIIYDCDGVLFDSLEANGKLYTRIAMSIRHYPLTESELKYCHSHTVYQAIHHLFGHHEDLEKKALEFLKQVDLKEFIVFLKMEPNLLDALSLLKKKGITRAISTNRTTSMKHIIERFGLGPYFEMVVTALDVKEPKPHPETVEKILSTFNIAKEKVLYVGDTEVDQETANAAGVKFIAYKNRELKGDGYIDDHLNLLNYLENGKIPQG